MIYQKQVVECDACKAVIEFKPPLSYISKVPKGWFIFSCTLNQSSMLVREVCPKCIKTIKLKDVFKDMNELIPK